MKKQNKVFLACKISAAVALGVISILMITIRSNLLDSAMNKGNFFRSLSIFVAVNAAVVIVGIFENYFSTKRYAENESNIMKELVDKHLSMSVEDLDNSEVKEKFDRVVSAGDFLVDYSESISFLFKAAVSILGTLFIFFRIDSKSTLALFIILTIFAFIEWKSSKKNAEIWVNYRKNMRRANYFSNVLINPIFSGERKIFNTTDFFKNKFDNSFSDAAKKNESLGFKRFVRDFSYDFVFMILILFFIRAFSTGVSKGNISVGIFTSLFYQIVGIRIVVSEALSRYFKFVNAKNKKSSVQKFLEESTDLDGSKNLQKIDTIEFKDVHFSYPGSTTEVLKGVSFKLERKSYGLVGENGSGKSTLTKLILGLYRPTSGKILINGVDISEYKQDEIKREMSIVMQNSYHYPATLRENFDFKKNSDINEHLIKTLKLDEVRDKLKKGYDTNLSQSSKDAVSLSGGEWQKIAIYRGLNKNSSLYVLDEPNALLDPVSEAKLYDVYKTELRDKMSILISHRLGATKEMDEILVLKDGKILHSGSHEELMKTEYYSTIYNTQKEMYL